mmetsp:Transcript_15544/g.33752  ORF Transcript_15544/g.33752 Transcript_15544/m.33752 type:complete len:615 (-) Transcript_15544:64-1908(-)|eukprot:CAMPEP_0206475948 /NCGR_PEP_ID=MMETSP0324_2-20121206/34401_1 /ASSEMBLY_ACC=CAM_ASM_000836 /TAXON_ID=2866 /ORGANISM="Crypthecodinium cohnii, Strain Seligo" /LENGTH=614 /DNA_ID=CAMNT_0053951439 /DNA_START=112 /DNA_END=1956 /DNA_ORIENTATION=+
MDPSSPLAAGEGFDDLTGWIRFYTTGAIIVISGIAWVVSNKDKGADVGVALRLKNENRRAFRGLLVPKSAIKSKKHEDANAEDDEEKKPDEPPLEDIPEEEGVEVDSMKTAIPDRPSRDTIQREHSEAAEAQESSSSQPKRTFRQRSQTLKDLGAVALEAANKAANRSAQALRHWYFHGGQTPWEDLELDKEKLKDKVPLLVFVNSRSGGGQGIQLLQELETYLNKIQVVDLAKEKSPMPALKWWAATGQTYKILVCGGDGTVGWVLTSLEELKPDLVPPVAILPVGTGNDLARVLGWGGGFGGGSIVPELQKVQYAHPAYLDRWQVVFRDVPDASRPKTLGDLPARRSVMMCNYLGVGIDAAVALDFHLMRERNPHLFISRLVNKIWYAKAGTLSPYRKMCEDLREKIKVECDGVPLQIPEDIHGIVILNIPSFGGGCDLWNSVEDSVESDSEDDDDEDDDIGPRVAAYKTTMEGPKTQSDVEMERKLAQIKPSMQDKKLEVVGVHGSMHLGAAQVGLYSAKRLKQASSVRITNKVPIPVQVDGEPEMFDKNGEINVTFGSQALMLAHSSQSASHAAAAEVIEWGISKGLIAADKRNDLMRHIASKAGSSKAA